MHDNTTPVIHLIHGCALLRQNEQQSDRNYVEMIVLRRFLASRVGKYSSFEASMGNISLTVDDSTVGAALACRMAREMGHEVTLFVNPHQIITEAPYFFS